MTERRRDPPETGTVALCRMGSQRAHGGTMRLERSLLGKTLVIIFVTALGAAGAVYGQFSQYTQPGTPTPGGGNVTRQALEEAVAGARWHLGGLRVDPWLALRNVSWVNNPAGEPDGAASSQSDVNAVGGAGLRAYLPTGPDVTWAAYALPEFVWWNKLSDRNRLNGRYGAGVFGYLNRLSFQASGTLAEQLGIITSEFPVLANSRRTEGSVGSTLRLGFSTGLFAEVATARTENLLDQAERQSGPQLQRLNRDERRLRTGLSYEPRPRWQLRAGVEWTEADFDADSRDLSNKGTAPLIGIRYEGPKVTGSVEVQQRSLEPKDGSEFVATDVTTYQGDLAAQGNRLSGSLYGRRTLTFALEAEYTHFQTDLVGVAVSVGLGRRTSLRGFAETGQQDYEAAQPEAPARQDDITAYGAELTMNLWRSAQLHLGGSESRFDSNLPGQDRTLTTVRAGISFGIGGEGPWV